jgi:hypothetical protein
MIDRLIDWYISRVLPAFQEAEKESVPILKDLSSYGLITMVAAAVFLAFCGFDLQSNPYGMGWEERIYCIGCYLGSALLLMGIAYKLNRNLKSRWLTESQAINVAIEALESQFGKDVILQHRPYRAILTKGLWHIHSNAKDQDGQPIFGTPSAQIRASNGQVTHLQLT